MIVGVKLKSLRVLISNLSNIKVLEEVLFSKIAGHAVNSFLKKVLFKLLGTPALILKLLVLKKDAYTEKAAVNSYKFVHAILHFLIAALMFWKIAIVLWLFQQIQKYH